MKRNIYDFTAEKKSLIKELYNEEYSVSDIAFLTDLSFQEVFFILKKMIKDFDTESNLSQGSITDEKILIVSDTHIGSQYENFDYIREAYRFAYQELEIRTALHGGDFLQSTYTNVQPKYRNEMDQVTHAIRDYPFFDEFTTHILFGNHDYNTLKKNPAYLDLIKTRLDFNLLGFKRAYLTWLKDLISLYHSTKKYGLSIPSLNTVLNLKGHSHQLSYNKENSIYIPTLSDDMLQHPLARPGFLIGTKKKNEIILESYYFKDSLHYGGKILTKKLK